MPSLTYPDGTLVKLGSKIAEGGEGIVYVNADRPSEVVKLYLKPPPGEVAEKLRAMIGMANPEVRACTAWPVSLVLKDGGVAGFTMPRLKHLAPLHHLFGVKERKAHFPEATWSYLAHLSLNLARAFDLLHAHAIIVGDVNQNNIIAEPKALVRLIDNDSFQLTVNGQLYRCGVGVPDYQPPELQNVDLRAANRTASADAFGLAILIFQLLFNGRHPFDGRLPRGAPGGTTTADHITAGHFFYAPALQSKGFEPPPGGVALAVVPPPMRSLFERAFLAPPPQRPTPSEWVGALSALTANIATCKQCAAHRYPNHLQNCPWCTLERLTGLTYFIIPTTVGAGGAPGGLGENFWLEIPEYTIERIWSNIKALPIPAKPATMPMTPPRPPATPLPPGVRWRSRASVGIMLLTILMAIIVLGLTSMSGYTLIVLVAGGAAAMTLRPDLREEAARRREAYAAAVSECDEARRLYGPFTSLDTITKVRDKAKTTYALLMTQQNRYDMEIGRLEKQKRAEQLERFLDRFRIVDSDIKGFGDTRKATLRSWNIETAADVGVDAILAVPGFGPGLANALVGWRNKIERTFVFDAKQSVDPAKIQAIRSRYRAERINLRDELNKQQRNLATLARAYEDDQAVAHARLERALLALAQADADLSALPAFARK